MIAKIDNRSVSENVDFNTAFSKFKRDGYIVFQSVIPMHLVDQMRDLWEEYFEPFRKARPELNRFLMHLPFKEPLCHPMFLENPLVIEMANRVLGKNYICGYLGSETPLPGSDYMQPHFDLAFWTKMRFLNPPLSFINKLAGSLNYYYGLQISVPLVDSTAENGPFEIWPATNRFSFRKRDPQLIFMPAGSIMVRDIRNLHRGTPNRSEHPRPFLSMVYMRPWVPKWRAPEIPLDTYENLSEESKRLFRWADIDKEIPTPERWASRAR